MSVLSRGYADSLHRKKKDKTMTDYRRILQMTKEATSAIALLESRREANLAELNGAISITQSALLMVARSAMRKALRCQTFTAVARLEVAYEKLHNDDPLFDGSARWFFMDLLVIRRMVLFHQSPFGESVERLFHTHPKLIAATFDGKMFSASQWFFPMLIYPMTSDSMTGSKPGRGCSLRRSIC